SKGMRYIAYLLERPNQWIESTNIFPPLKPIGCPAAETATEVALPNKTARRGLGWKQAKETKLEWHKQMKQISSEIEEARASGIQMEVDELQEQFDQMKEQYNQHFNRDGFEREFVDTTEQNATNRVRNAINRVLAQCLQGGKDWRYALTRWAQLLKSTINC